MGFTERHSDGVGERSNMLHASSPDSAKGESLMERDEFLRSGTISRRSALRLLAASGAVALLAACRGAGPAPAATAATSATQASAPASSAAKTGGTLNVALSDLGNENLDVILASTNNN